MAWLQVDDGVPIRAKRSSTQLAVLMARQEHIDARHLLEHVEGLVLTGVLADKRGCLGVFVKATMVDDHHVVCCILRAHLGHARTHKGKGVFKAHASYVCRELPKRG